MRASFGCRARAALQRGLHWLNEDSRLLVLAVFAGGTAVGAFYTASRVFDPWIHSLVGWLDRWQTLFAAGLATGVAFFAILPVYAQLGELRRQSATIAVPVLRIRAEEQEREESQLSSLHSNLFLVEYFLDEIIDSITAGNIRTFGAKVWYNLYDCLEEGGSQLDAHRSRDPNSSDALKSRVLIGASVESIRGFFEQKLRESGVSRDDAYAYVSFDGSTSRSAIEVVAKHAKRALMELEKLRSRSASERHRSWAQIRSMESLARGIERPNRD